MDQTPPPPVSDWELRARLMAWCGTTVLLDVGANAGQYAGRMREHGYTGRIVSFEPLSEAFSQLRERAAASHGGGNGGLQGAWECRQLALGSRDGEAVINVASNSLSSSLLPMLDLHLEAAPEAGYVDTELVRTARLDTLAEELLKPGDSVFLKLDVQGFEAEVLAGAEATLPRIRAVELEMSLTPLYAGERTWLDTTRAMERLGYEVVFLGRDFFDPRTGRVLQVNGIFRRP